MKPFTLEVIKDYKLFYILKKIDANAQRIVLSHQQSHINAVVIDYELFRMADNSVMIAFKNPFPRTPDYNYIASDGRTEEIIPIQSFERIVKHYKLGPEVHATGTFVFTDSTIDRLAVQDWRCDNQKFGPKAWAALTEEGPFLTTGIDNIDIYEPIFSLVGTGHIIYLKQKVRSDNSDEILNNSYTPFACYTLAETVKLTLEWAAMNSGTFNNYEEIAVKARKFTERLGITEDLVANQPDMQVYEYLKGNPNARQRPDSVQAMSDELDKFIQNNVSYFTFSKLISLNPTAWNLNEVLEYEKEYAKQEWKEYLEKFHVLEETEYGDTEGVYAYIEEHLPNTLMFVRILFGILSIKKEILEGLA